MVFNYLDLPLTPFIFHSLYQLEDEQARSIQLYGYGFEAIDL